MPNRLKDDEMPWGKSEDKDDIQNKHFYVCHAEMNAILNRFSADLRGCKIYVGLFPCNECAKMIVQSNIEEVIYHSDKYSDKPKYRASKLMLEKAGVKLSQYKGRSPEIKYSFNEQLDTSVCKNKETNRSTISPSQANQTSQRNDEFFKCRNNFFNCMELFNF